MYFSFEIITNFSINVKNYINFVIIKNLSKKKMKGHQYYSSEVKIEHDQDFNVFLSNKSLPAEEIIKENMRKTHLISDKKQKSKKNFSTRFEKWENKEVQKVFSLYQQYGPQWKLISQQFSERIPNSIKNRFYTTLRNMLKSLFRAHPKIKKIPHQIASKDLYKFYHGREEFSDMKGFATILLKRLKYGNENNVAMKACEQYQEQIFKIYAKIFQKEGTENEEAQSISARLENKHEQRNIFTSAAFRTTGKMTEISQEKLQKNPRQNCQASEHANSIPLPAPIVYFLNCPLNIGMPIGGQFYFQEMQSMKK